MATRKRNDFLETEESQSDEAGYDSEAEELYGKLHRGRKRRKISLDRDHGETSDDDLDESEIDESKDDHRTETRVATEQPQEDEASLGKSPRGTNGTSKSDSKTKAKAKGKSKGKTGVVYLSRIPPFMKPATVKNLLEPYGAITRIFLTPEDPQSHSTRVRHGGNKKRSFVDGWVEFQHKSDAKAVAETLNANIIGGKKGSYYHDDVWNMRYLRGFKWKDLTEQIKNENAERASRLRMEIAQTTRENKRFIESVEKAKMLERMEGKRKRRDGIEDDTATGGLSSAKTSNLVDVNNHQAPGRKGESNGTSKAPDEKAQKVLDMVL